MAGTDLKMWIALRRTDEGAGWHCWREAITTMGAPHYLNAPFAGLAILMVRSSEGDGVRSEAEIERVRAIFMSTGDDPPALNTAVRDALAWVLGLLSAEELIDEYFVAGEDYHCFTCPARIWVQECLATVRSATAGPEGVEQFAVTSTGQEVGL